jgi:hypothetical protein
MHDDIEDLPGEQRHDRPFNWWGPSWLPAEPKSLLWLIQAGTLSPREAAFLSLASELRRSIIVAAEPQKAGKTTVLTALTDFLPSGTQPIYLRGLYERFAFLEEAAPANSYLLCNEISAHLPVYLWGKGVRQLFAARQAGFPFAGTMHAGSAADILDQLLGYPLEVPADQAALLDLAVVLDAGHVDDRLVRRVVQVAAVQPRDGRPVAETLSSRESLRGQPVEETGRMVRVLAGWAGLTDEDASRLLATRERLLQAWLQAGVIEPEAVRAALAEYRQI